MATSLQFINTFKITTSGVASTFDVTNVFSDKYDDYVAYLTGFSTTTTSAQSMTGRLINSSDTVISTSNYDTANLDLKGETSFGEIKGTNADSFGNAFLGTIDDSPRGTVAKLIFYKPYTSNYTFFQTQGASRYDSTFRGKKGIAVLKLTDSITGFRVYTQSSGNYASGTISVYGVK